MTMNPLPPQAYTKETLAKAFAWLQTQPENIKELASSTDVLVSLYLKAKLNGDSALDRPSIQNFKSELKSLAGMMGEFEEETPLRPFYSHQASAAPTPPAKAHSEPVQTPRSANETAAVHADLRFDARTNAMIQEVKTEFNLSSDSEALRLLISVGFKGLKRL